MGRPLKEIDAEQVFKLARLGCTQEEIGEWFGVDHAQISRRFAQEYQLGRGACKTSLRRAQFKTALGGCAAMLIHLGKQYLGQTDRLDLNANVQSTRWFERVCDGRNGPPLSPTETEGVRRNGS